MKRALTLIAMLMSVPALAGEAPLVPRSQPVGDTAAAPAARAPARRPAQLGTWDVDGDNIISDVELARGFGHVGTFDRWDLDDDGRIERSELAAGLATTPLFVNADTNRDGRLNRAELTVAFGDAAPFDEMDLGDDETVTASALYAAIYENWDDDDDGLTRNELYSGFATLWDLDDDGELTESEFMSGWRALTMRERATASV